MEESEEALIARLERDPNDADAEISLAYLRLREGRAEEGFAALRRAIRLRPDDIDARRTLAFALHHEERLEEAEAGLREWQEHDPQSPVARHLLAAFGGTATPSRAADDYIALMFDRVAAEFDDHIGSLGYRAPHLVAQALETAAGSPSSKLDVLDAGCGTGLCGPLLRPWARHLTGIDLSSAMIAQAELRGCYDRLLTTELTAFLAEAAKAWDVIVSADTFCYFGDLGPAFAAARDALRPDGLFVFTTEAAEEAGESFRLNWWGRYSHGEVYLKAILEATGLEMRRLAVETLRFESGRPVTGQVTVAQRRR